MKNKLYRSKENRVIAGVCGGIGEYMDADPAIIRLIWVLLSIFAGMGVLGIIAYFASALIIPEKPDVTIEE